MEEKQAQLFEAGRTLFTQYGFKATSVAAIAKQAGLAVGTFYLYYPSKERLFLDIFIQENERLKQQCQDGLSRMQEPKEVIMHMLSCNAQGMQKSPILREWYNRKVFDKLERLYRKEHGNTSVHFLFDTFMKLVEKWQADGKIRGDIDAATIMQVFTAIINVDLHKEEIGIEYFPRLLEVLTTLVLDGLVPGGSHALV